VSPVPRPKSRSWLVWALALAGVFVAAAFVARGGGVSGASALSRSPDGLLGAKTYLERRGSKVTVSDAPFSSWPSENAVLLAFPLSVSPSKEELDAMRRGVAAGGTLVIAFSGRARAPVEGAILKDLGVEPVRVRETPLLPLRWWAAQRATWSLRPDASLGAAARELEIRAPVFVPPAGPDATVLYRGEKDRPAVFVRKSGRGRIVVLPTDAISNGRLSNAAGADLLESLRAGLPEGIVFDEYHHGLRSATAPADSGSVHSLDLLLVELVLIYCAALLALGRRFGPAWEEPVDISGSSAAFLLGLGALHHRLRHGDEASARLAEAAARLDTGMRRWVRPAAADASGTGETAFLDLARAIGRSQRNRRYS
jgi:hypothetical protein